MARPRGGEEAVFLGNRVKERRVAMGLSQEELSTISGICQSSISHIERGGGTSVVNLFKVAAALGMTPSDMIAENSGH